MAKINDIELNNTIVKLNSLDESIIKMQNSIISSLLSIKGEYTGNVNSGIEEMNINIDKVLKELGTYRVQYTSVLSSIIERYKKTTTNVDNLFKEIN